MNNNKKVKLLFCHKEQVCKNFVKKADFIDKQEKLKIPYFDLFLALSNTNTDTDIAYFFIEADMGTETHRILKRKFNRYIWLYENNFHKQIFKIPYFLVLVITTSDKRSCNILETIRQLKKCQSMFRVCSIKELIDNPGARFNLNPEYLFKPVWYKAKNNHPKSILEL